jgi:hypothetical protein
VKLGALAIVLVGCGASPASSAPDAGTDAHAKDSAALDVATTPDDAGPAKITVSGDVVDMQGAPWANAKVQVCSAALCTLGNADGAGAFAVQVPAGSHYHVIARPSPNDPLQASASAGLGVLADTLVADTALASPVPIPITGAHASLAAPAAVTTDLTLAANAADVAFSGEAYFSGVSIPQASWPAFVIAGKTILAMWALDPWGTRTTPGKTITVTIANSFGLAPSDVASVYAVNEATAELGAPTEASVSSDGTTLAGATIDRVTWIVLAH